MLLRHGAYLARQRNHLVFRSSPSGKVWVMAKTPSDVNGDLNNLKQLQRFVRSERPTDSQTLRGKREERRLRRTKEELDAQIKALDEVLVNLEAMETLGKGGWALIEKAGLLSVPILSFQESIAIALKNAPESVRQSVTELIDGKLGEIYRISFEAMRESGLPVVYFDIDEKDPGIKVLQEKQAQEDRERKELELKVQEAEKLKDKQIKDQKSNEAKNKARRRPWSAHDKTTWTKAQLAVEQERRKKNLKT